MHANKWISFKLEGSSKNVDAIGAKVIVTTSKGQVHRVVNTGGSFGSNPLRLEIGLGDCNPEINVLVMWPDKARSKTELSGIAVNKAYKIKQTDNSIEAINFSSYDFNKSGGGHHHH